LDAQRLPAPVAARAYVLAALIFSARDDRSFDPVRAASYADRAEVLLGDGDDDQHVLLAFARVAAARFTDPLASHDVRPPHTSAVDRARSPLAQLLAVALRGLAAHAAGDEGAAVRYAETTRSMALELGLGAWYVALLADRAQRMIRGAHPVTMILRLVQEARELVASARLPVSESYLVLLGAEIEALGRAARVAEAIAAAREALDVAAVAGLGVFPFVFVVARLYVGQSRLQEISELACKLEADGSASGSPGIDALAIRAYHCILINEPERAIRLSEEVCEAAPGTIGLPYVIHDAFAVLIAARLSVRDAEGTRLALRRLQTLLRERPSAWHAAMTMRQHAYLLMLQGHPAEARQKLEATVATFGMVGDVLQALIARLILARVAVANGAPGAAAQEQRLREELARHDVELAPEYSRFTSEAIAAYASEPLSPPTLTERMVVAVERLSVRGLPPDVVARELSSILSGVFPKHEVVVEGNGIVTAEHQVFDVGMGSRLVIRGALDAEHRAALRLLSMVVPMIASQSTPVTEEQVAVDAVLPGFVANAPVSRRLKAEVAQLARSSATILIDGESGSGKEVVARAVHDLSARAERPYVVFNCASIPRELFESQLFGHRKGAFTGAVADHLGVVRAAESGTLFLDEIGELPLELQPKLLRFLENGEVLPVGESKPRQVDVRIIAATHRDLAAFVQDGRFRQDLYYRLNVVPLRVPPLRDRKDDVLELARLFISRLAPEGTEPPHLAPDAIAALMSHRWPGNVRELRNLIERAMAYAPVPRILHASDLRIADRQAGPP
jgi:transcriptional regulator with AAA-type ATPase domain